MEIRISRGAWACLCLVLISSTVRAETLSLAPPHLSTAPRIDGHLDDAQWSSAAVATGFIQQRPASGEPATSKSIVRVVYDAEGLYIGFECFDADPSRILHRSLGRDADVFDDDYFALILDTYLDRQNGYLFQVNPNGVRRDVQFRGEGASRALEWDGVWRAATLITDRGWQGEIAIPWKMLRFPRADELSMGINFERQQRAVNEQSHWAAVDRQYNIYRVASAGTIDGLYGISPGRNILLRPFALARTERGAINSDDAWSADSWDGGGDVGLDIRAGVGSELTLDLTVNTDFAQVEVDDQRVNLTRFPLFFPEKREFFLEKRDLFIFGSPGNHPFFSRRIGIDVRGASVPIDYGARLTGKLGRTEIGLMDMRTGETEDVPERRFDIVRLSQDFGRRSRIGAIAIVRMSDNDASDSRPREEVNRSFGVDADLRPFDGLDIAAFGAFSEENGAGSDDAHWGTRWRYTNDLWVLTYFHESVGADYDPKAGFIGRPNVNQDAIGWTWAPEPNWKWIRRFDNFGQFSWIDRRFDRAGSESGFESRYIHVHPTAIGHSGQVVGLFWETSFERLYEEFDVGQGVEFPAGDFHFSEYGFDASTDPSRPIWFGGDGIFGNYFDGTQQSFRVAANSHLWPQFRASFELQHDIVERDQNRFESDILRLRLGFDASNDLRFDALTQWSSAEDRILSQLRAHYLFGDESDVFLVFNDGRTDRENRFAPRRADWTLKLSYAYAL